MMRFPRFLFAGLCSALVLRVGADPVANENTPPRLAVVISVDQCRADYLVRFRPYFSQGGFRRLLEQGADFRDAHQRHAATATAPGHATILSGVSPSEHGIIANEWFDFSAGRLVGAVEDPAAPLIGAAPVTGPVLPGGADAEMSGSPRAFRASTVGDQLKLRYGASSRVIALANKDRAAIFLGGRLADAAYWMVNGRVVTSRYYRNDLPSWVADFNAEDRINHAFGHTWDRLLEASVYDAVQGPDNAPGEESRHGLGVTFPRKIDGGAPTIGAEFYNAFRLDPYGSVLLGELAQRAVKFEQLGKHATPDLLCVSFSQPDYAGHSYGPDSHEIMDSILRLDRVIEELLAYLDREVGPGRYVVVLTGDHGVAPLPERVQAFERNVVAGRLDFPKLNTDVEAALTAAFGQLGNASWALHDGLGYRLVPQTLAAMKISSSDAQSVLKAALMRSPQVAFAWTRDELLGKVLASGPFKESWQLSYDAERSQEVVFIPATYVVNRSPAGTNHGTPYDYDNHVPLVWYGSGVRAGIYTQRVGIDSLAPTLSAILSVPPPPLAKAPLLF
jgi:hypothetical protein